MAICSSADSVLEAAALIKANGTKLDTFVNGTSTETVQLGTGDPTPSLRKFIADAQDVVTQAALDAGQTVLDDVAQNAQDIAALESGKADKVAGATAGHLASLDASGNLLDSGEPAGAIDELRQGKADKFVPADVGNLAELDASGNLREAGRAAEDFVLLLAYANDEALDLALLNRMNIEVYEEWYTRGIAHLNAANTDAMKTVQSIRDVVNAFDESYARHRLQIRLFDGTNPTSASKPVLFVISGQSNAVGRGGRVFDSAEDCGTYWSWADGADELKPIADPTGQIVAGENGSRGDSGWPSFARMFFALTGRKVVLLNIASGGSTVTDAGFTTTNTWADNGYGNLRSTRTAIWNAFDAAVPAASYDLGAILWCQGENDASRLYAGSISVADYIGNWEDLSEGTKGVLQWTRNLIGASGCPVFLAMIGHNGECRTSSQWLAAYSAIHAAQASMFDYENIYPGFCMAPYFIDAWSDYMFDGYHYSHFGYRLQGQALARSVVNYLNF